MSNTLGWIIVAFVLYLLGMVAVGAAYAKKNSSAEDYFLGGRSLGGFVAALSAQASDMSGWLLMGLPGGVYALGTGQSWIAIGLFLGTVVNWLVISGPLRRYTIRANNSLTLPTYFENRFHDKKKVLLLISSITIVIFFLVYTASALASGGKLFNSVFGVDYRIALTIGALVILVYTFLGGFMAVCVTDFIQGTLMLIGLLIVPIMAYGIIGGNLSAALDAQGVAGGSSAFLSLVRNGDKTYSAIDIISQLAWGLGYCGMPHILVRFMAVRDEKEKIIDLKETIRKNAQGKNYTNFINYMEENNISFSSPITIKEYLEKVFFDINDHLFIKNIEEIIPILEEYLKKEKIKINQVSLLGEGEYKKVLKVGNYAFKIGYENEVNEIPEDELILKPIMKKNVSQEKAYAIYVGIQPLLNDKWYLNLTDEEIENKLYEIYKTLKDKGINWVDIKKENIGKKDEKLYIIDDDYIYTNTKDITLSPKRYIEYTDRYYKEKVRK